MKLNTRCCLHSAIGLLAATRCCLAANGTDPWFRQPFGMLQTNLREIDADMDVNAVADFIQDCGATAWLFSVGGILANYPTELDFQIANPYLSQRESGDLVQDAIEAAHARDMRLLARVDFSKVQLPVAEEHPEWLYISPNGTWQNHTNNLVSVCPSGGWYQERIFDILDEVTDRYPLDGFFVNWAGMNERDYFRVYHGVCHCESCQAHWEEDFGDEDMPEGPDDDNYPQWKTWSDGIVDAWTERVRDFIAEKLPDAGLILGVSADIMFHESNNAVGRDMWHHATAETVSKFTSHRPDVPVLVNAAVFLDLQYRMASEHPALYAQYHLQAIARGANPSTYLIGVPGKIPWPGLQGSGEIMRFHKSNRDVYEGLKPVAKTGLVLPQESQMNASDYEMALAEFRGLYSSLQELHVPFDVIARQYIAEMAEEGGLERYEVLLLPSLGELTTNDTEALDEWVASGGTLIATGAVGVDGQDEMQLKSLPASSLLNATTEEEELWSTYLAPEQNQTEENYYTGNMVPIVGGYYEYEWKEGSEGRYKKLDYAPFAPPEYIYGNVQVDERGVGIGRYESGRGIIVPFNVGWAYREVGLASFRQFIEEILVEYGANETLKFDVPDQVEVTVMAAEGRTVVHLINVSGVKYQNFGNHLPVPGGRITVTNGGAVYAKALVAGRELEVSDGEIALPGFDLFEVVVIEGLE